MKDVPAPKRISGVVWEYQSDEQLVAILNAIAGLAGSYRLTFRAAGTKCASDPLGQRGEIGIVREEIGGGAESAAKYQPCHRCIGTGRNIVHGDACSECHGAGRTKGVPATEGIGGA